MTSVMQLSLVLCLVASGAALDHQAHISPVTKVLEILQEVKGKIEQDTADATQTYHAFEAWCYDSGKDYEHDISEEDRKLGDLDATISKAKGDISNHMSKIEELSGDIDEASNSIAAAARVRGAEHKTFITAEKELMDTVDTLDRAINVLRRNLKGSAFVQANMDMGNVNQLVATLTQVVEGAGVSLDDKQRLLAFAQTKAGASTDADSDEDDELGAPAAKVYDTKSGSIVEVLEDLREKAQEELRELRQQENAAQFTFDTRKKSLEDEIHYTNQEVSQTRGDQSDCMQTKATSESDYTKTFDTKDLTEEQLAKLKEGCATAKADYATSSRSRKQELEAIASAIQFLSGKTDAAEKRVYSDDKAESFLEIGSVRQHKNAAAVDESPGALVVARLRKLAKSDGSASLSQLASRIGAVLKFGGSDGVDPFAKVKQMIADMVAKLEGENSAEASHKAWCDTQKAETEDKKTDLKEQIELLTSKIDRAKAAAAKLKDEAAEANDRLSEIAKMQKDMDAIRKKEHYDFVKAKADLDTGLQSVRFAMKVLNDYYAKHTDSNSESFAQEGSDADATDEDSVPTLHQKHEANAGAGQNVIGMLEVIEADFGQNLAQVESTEEDASNEYELTTKNNKLETVALQEDLEYKKKTITAFEKHIADKSSDRESSASELDSVLEYERGIYDKCTVKPEPYEERKERRDAEIAGLKDAIQSLSGEAAAFLQTKKAGFLQK